MDDIFRHLVITPGDEYLLAGKQEVIILRHRLTRHRGEIGARAGLCQAHRAHPFATYHIRQIGTLQFIRTMHCNGLYRAGRQKGTQGKCSTGGIPDFRSPSPYRPWHGLSTIFLSTGEPGPAIIHVLPVGFGKPRGLVHTVIFECGPQLVTNGIQGGQHLAAKATCFLQNGKSQFGIYVFQVCIEANLIKIKDMIE